MDLKHVHVDDGAGNKYDLVEIDGVVFPSYFAEDPVQRLTDVQQMEGRDDDVIIIAYPKAGTHWVWEMTSMLLRGEAEYHPTMKEAQMMELSPPLDAKDMPSPRVFNTHLRFRQLPKDMVSRNVKLVYVIRNPKDMAVSRYVHNSKGLVGYKGTFGDYLPLYMDGKVAFGSWFDYTLEWHKTMQENKDYPIHTICYEDLKRDPITQVRQLADFLEIKCDDSLIEQVCHSCNFNNLKQSYEKTKKSFDKENNPNDYAFRKGQIGDWKNWFTVAQSEQFDSAIKQRMEGYEGKFQYE